MNKGFSEDEILMLLNDVTITNEELSNIELSDIQMKKIHRHILSNIRPGLFKRGKWIVAVSLTLICMVVYISKPVIARNALSTINLLIFGQDKVLEKAVKNNYIEPISTSPVYSNGVEVQLTNILFDKTKLALSFSLKFDDTKLLNNVQGIYMDLQIIDEKNRILVGYYDQDLSDKRMMKAISTGADYLRVVDKNKGLVRYNYIADSDAGNIPQLDKLKINIKSINYQSSIMDYTDSIDGNWAFSIDVSDKFKNDTSIKFLAEKNSTGISIRKAETTPACTLVVFTAPKNTKIDVINDVTLTDNKGNIENTAGAVGTQDYMNTTTYTMTFPITTFDNPDILKLSIKDYKDKDIEIKLHK